MNESQSLVVEQDGPVRVVRLNRPHARNAVDGPTSARLAQAFRDFDADASASVAVLCGAGEHFCAGADLKSIAVGLDGHDAPPLNLDMAQDGPMGPTRLQLSKPVIAAVSGYAVAGGLELALWCDLRVADATAVFGVFCRRFGVPLIDGGTVRLARLIGESRALDLVLTGRAVAADEALAMGLANRVAPAGQAFAQALAVAHELARLPQTCLRNDRASLLHQHGLPLRVALEREFALGMKTLASGESVQGASRFAGGAGRGGRRAD
jgi:enoyl-CoA hydratase